MSLFHLAYLYCTTLFSCLLLLRVCVCVRARACLLFSLLSVLLLGTYYRVQSVMTVMKSIRAVSVLVWMSFCQSIFLVVGVGLLD